MALLVSHPRKDEDGWWAGPCPVKSGHGYDTTSNVYESDWPPTSTLEINLPPAEKPYVTFSAPQPRPASTRLHTPPIEVTRTDPGPVTKVRGVAVLRRLPPA